MSRPYVFINDQMQTFMSLRASLGLDAKTAARFDRVNPHLINQVVTPGQLVIVPDSSTALVLPKKRN